MVLWIPLWWSVVPCCDLVKGWLSRRDAKVECWHWLLSTSQVYDVAYLWFHCGCCSGWLCHCGLQHRFGHIEDLDCGTNGGPFLCEACQQGNGIGKQSQYCARTQQPEQEGSIVTLPHGGRLLAATKTSIALRNRPMTSHFRERRGGTIRKRPAYHESSDS